MDARDAVVRSLVSFLPEDQHDAVALWADREGDRIDCDLRALRRALSAWKKAAAAAQR